jgi:tetratricopeptide (TPR) repeat protein
MARSRRSRNRGSCSAANSINIRGQSKGSNTHKTNNGSSSTTCISISNNTNDNTNDLHQFSPTATTQYVRAVSLLEQKRYMEAVPLLRSVVQIWQEIKGPSSNCTLHAKSNLGFCLLQQGLTEDAIEVYKQILGCWTSEQDADGTREAVVNYLLGACLCTLQRHDEAIGHLRRVTALTKDWDFDAIMAKQQREKQAKQDKSHRQQQQRRHSSKLVDDGVDDDMAAEIPDMREASRMLAQCCIQVGQHAEAEALLKEAVQRDDARAGPFVRVAARVVTDMEMVRTESMERARLRFLLGTALMKQHKYFDAERPLQQFVSFLCPRDSDLAHITSIATVTLAAMYVGRRASIWWDFCTTCCRLADCLLQQGKTKYNGDPVMRQLLNVLWKGWVQRKGPAVTNDDEGVTKGMLQVQCLLAHYRLHEEGPTVGLQLFSDMLINGATNLGSVYVGLIDSLLQKGMFHQADVMLQTAVLCADTEDGTDGKYVNKWEELRARLADSLPSSSSTDIIQVSNEDVSNEDATTNKDVSNEDATTNEDVSNEDATTNEDVSKNDGPVMDAISRLLLAHTYFNMSAFDRAMQLYKGILDFEVSAWPSMRHSATAMGATAPESDVALKLAACSRQLGQHAEAEEHLRGALARQKAALGEDNLTVFETRLELVDLLLGMEDRSCRNVPRDLLRRPYHRSCGASPGARQVMTLEDTTMYMALKARRSTLRRRWMASMCCAQCGTSGAQLHDRIGRHLKVCAGCIGTEHESLYCDQACQRQHWSRNGGNHRAVCSQGRSKVVVRSS